MQPDGTFLPGTGTLSRFQPPAGRGVRVDTAGYPGYTVNPHYDSLLAKVITDGGTLEEAARRAVRALAEFDIAGVPTNVGLLQALLTGAQTPGLGTFEVGWVDAHAAQLVTASAISLVPAAADPAGPRRSPPLWRCRPATPRCARRWPARWFRSRSRLGTRSLPATSWSSSRR